MLPVPVFVGYDPREAVAYHVCCNSIIRLATAPVAIVPLYHRLPIERKAEA